MRSSPYKAELVEYGVRRPESVFTATGEHVTVPRDEPRSYLGRGMSVGRIWWSKIGRTMLPYPFFADGPRLEGCSV